MTLIVLTQASASAPACEGVNGSLNAVVNFCVTHTSLGAGAWAREFNNAATNESIFRPASGNRFRLYLRHDSVASGSATRCIARGCESASAYNLRTDEFPLAAQVADASANWVPSTTADGTDRNYIAIVTETFLLLFIRVDGTTFEMCFFGDVPGTESADTYDTFITCRQTTVTTIASNVSGSLISNIGAIPTAGCGFWARSIDGSIKSTRGFFLASGTALGTVINAPAMKVGYSNRIVREKISIGCGGSQSTTVGVLHILRRGWLPNVWQPQHNGRGGVASEDTAADTPYSASALFRIISAGGAAANSLITEESDTWSAPVG